MATGQRARHRKWMEFADETWSALAAEVVDEPRRFDPSTLEGLPPSAKRFLTRVLPPDVPLWDVVEIDMEGEIKLGGRWLPFTATQILRAGVGFVWAPVVGSRLLRFLGADVLGPDHARMEFRFQGWLPVARAHGPDVRRSAQGRLAAETVAWLPQALTPQLGARWVGVDDERAIVTLDAAGDEVDVEVAVGDDGEIRWIGLQRWNGSAKPPVLASFGGSVGSAHVAADGVCIAGSGAVGWEWHTPQESDGVFFRYRVTAARFGNAAPG